MPATPRRAAVTSSMTSPVGLEPSGSQAILITPNTVHAHGEVFPIAAVCSFGQVSKPRYPIRLRSIVITFFLWSTTASLAGYAHQIVLHLIAWMLFATLAAMVYVKFINAQIHGIGFSLASGETRFYLTNDQAGAEQATTWVTQMVEGVEQTSARIVVNKNKVTITESTITGDVTGGNHTTTGATPPTGPAHDPAHDAVDSQGAEGTPGWPPVPPAA